MQSSTEKVDLVKFKKGRKRLSDNVQILAYILKYVM